MNIVLLEQCPPHSWLTFSPTVGNYSCTKCGQRCDPGDPDYEDAEREYLAAREARAQKTLEDYRRDHPRDGAAK